MLPKPAQYLLRFDDLSPSLRRQRWEGYAALIEKFNIRPILAIIPDNRSEEWESAQKDPGFWAEMREMEAAGATIAIHGYQHRCESSGRCLLNLHRRTEFGGVELETQKEWIRIGKQILEEHGLSPKLWVAPRHGFDTNTLRALKAEGMPCLSDGFARVPFVREGVVWIPQQLWKPVVKAAGLWTICIHPEMDPRSNVRLLASFLEKHAEQFTSFDRVGSEYACGELGLKEKLYARLALWRVQRRHRRSRRRSRRR